MIIRKPNSKIEKKAKISFNMLKIKSFYDYEYLIIMIIIIIVYVCIIV